MQLFAISQQIAFYTIHTGQNEISKKNIMTEGLNGIVTRVEASVISAISRKYNSRSFEVVKVMSLWYYKNSQHSILYMVSGIGFNCALWLRTGPFFLIRCGYANNQNNRYWCIENPYVLHKVLLHDLEVGVCCAISARRIITPVCSRNIKLRTLCVIYCHPSSINWLMIKYCRPKDILCKTIQQHILESFMHSLDKVWSWNKAVGMPSRYVLDDRKGWSSSTGNVKNFLFASAAGLCEGDMSVATTSLTM